MKMVAFWFSTLKWSDWYYLLHQMRTIDSQNFFSVHRSIFSLFGGRLQNHLEPRPTLLTAPRLSAHRVLWDVTRNFWEYQPESSKSNSELIFHRDIFVFLLRTTLGSRLPRGLTSRDRFLFRFPLQSWESSLCQKLQGISTHFCRGSLPKDSLTKQFMN